MKLNEPESRCKKGRIPDNRRGNKQFQEAVVLCCNTGQTTGNPSGANEKNSSKN